MRIGFFGAAGEVTGSCTVVDTGSTRFLVDCGMFQGGAEARAKNLAALDFGFNVRELDFVVLTHAHIDHSGLLPRLAVMGYRGPVYATTATVELLEILLPDSAHIQEKESEWQLRHQHRRGKGGRLREMPPLYTVAQAQTALQLLKPAPLEKTLRPADSVELRFHEAGHILGSSWLEVVVTGAGRPRRLVFSGDLGTPGRPVLHSPAPIVPETDLLLVESTYGNRRHRSLPDTENEIADAFARTRATHGNLVIPSFAVGRTQEILYILADLIRRERIPPLKVYVDSPMANLASRITLAHPELLSDETHALIDWLERHPEKMKVQMVGDVEESRALNDVKHGAVIISASGMCDAGRIKYHLRENLPRSECTVLIAGFQAAGTLGRRLVDGARLVHIFGQPVPVRARIYTVGGLSAHADQPAIMGWLRGLKRPPAQAFVMHGEPSASQGLTDALKETLGWTAVRTPQRGEWVEF